MHAPRITRLLTWILAASCYVSAQVSKEMRSVDKLYADAQQAEERNDIPAAIKSYETILRVDPQLAAAYNNLGALYYDSGEYQGAIDVLQRGLRLNPKMGPAHAILGSAYLAIGEYSNAAAQFKFAVAENPNDRRSEDLLEQTLISLKQYALVEERLRKRVSMHPEDQDAWYRLGKVYLQLSQESLGRAESIAPGSPISHLLQGEIVEGMGDLEGAKAQYQKAVEADTRKPGTHEHMGNIFWLQGEWAAARTEFNAELQNDPGNCRAQWKVGNTLLNQQLDFDQALQSISIAIQRCPDLMQARVDRARALVQLNRAPEGLEDLLIAAKANPDEPSIHFWLAKVYRAEGRSSEASAEMHAFSELLKQNTAAKGSGVVENTAAALKP
jgi:tetratricopeptide (TPR) repeat protein